MLYYWCKINGQDLTRLTSPEQIRCAVSFMYYSVDFWPQTGCCCYGILFFPVKFQKYGLKHFTRALFFVTMNSWLNPTLEQFVPHTTTLVISFLARLGSHPLVKITIPSMQQFSDVIFIFGIEKQRFVRPIIASLCPASNAFPVTNMTLICFYLLPPAARIYGFSVSLPWKCHKKGWQLQFIVALTGERSW